MLKRDIRERNILQLVREIRWKEKKYKIIIPCIISALVSLYHVQPIYRSLYAIYNQYIDFFISCKLVQGSLYTMYNQYMGLSMSWSLYTIYNQYMVFLCRVHATNTLVSLCHAQPVHQSLYTMYNEYIALLIPCTTSTLTILYIGSFLYISRRET